MFAFQCSLIQIYEQTNMFLLIQPKKRLSFKVIFQMRGSKIKLDLLYRLIDVRFENWGILARVYPRIFPSFNWGPFGHLMGLH